MSSPTAAKTTDFERVHRDFLELESDLGLFEWYVEGFPVWERIRNGVYNDIMQESGVFTQAHPAISKDATELLKGGLMWGKNLFVKNPLFAGEHELLVWGHKRRKRLDDGNWWDVIYDPLLASGEFDYLMIEDDYNLSHRTPTKSENVQYLDFVTFSSTIYRKLAAHHSIPSEDRANELEREIESRFGTTVDVATRIYEEVTDRRVYLPLYRRLLRKVDPSVVLIAISYGKETFVEACRKENIPVVEFQHGTIDEYHVGYSFEGDRTKRDFPDYLFTFGPFWNQEVSLPIDDERVFPVGYEFLETKHQKFANREETNEIVFVSQGTVATKLSKMAVNLSERIDDHRVVYKLHPGEYDRWKESYPWLEDSSVEVVTDSPTLYELLGRASAQVGVYSTAVYEGLRFGRETVLVGLPGIEHMRRLIENYDVPVVTDNEDLAEELKEPKNQQADWEEFFSPNPKQRFRDALDAVASDWK